MHPALAELDYECLGDVPQDEERLMTIKLSQWERHYPDGCSLSTFQRIGRLIRRLGTELTVDIKRFDQEGLRAAVAAAEKRFAHRLNAN